MVRKSANEKISAMLKETITLLCKNCIAFRKKFTIEAVIGVTVDDSDVLLVSMNEMVQSEESDRGSDDVEMSKDPNVGSTPLELTPTLKRKCHRHSPFQDMEDNVSLAKPVVTPSDGGRDELGSDGEKKVDTDLLLVKEEVMDRAYEMEEVTPVADKDANIQTSHDISTEMVGSQHMSLMLANHNITNSSPIIVQPAGIIAAAESPPQTDVSSEKYNKQNQGRASHPFVCSFCSKPCTSRSNLVMHENWHRGKYNYECRYCGKKFMSTTSLRGHLPAHTGIMEFKCGLCTAEYKYKIQLKKHLSDVHQIRTPPERRGRTHVQ